MNRKAPFFMVKSCTITVDGIPIDHYCGSYIAAWNEIRESSREKEPPKDVDITMDIPAPVHMNNKSVRRNTHTNNNSVRRNTETNFDRWLINELSRSNGRF